MNFQTGLGKNQNPVSKIPRAKRTGDVAQVGDHLLSKAKAVSSNTSTSKKKKDRPKLEVGTVTPPHLAQPIPATQAPLRCLEYLPPRSALWIIKEFHEIFNSLNSRDIYFSNVNSKF
jgi:hypothetical protein